MRMRLPLPELQTVQLPVCCLSCRLSYTTARLPTCEPHVTLSNHASAVASELATSRPDQIKMHKMAKTYAPGSEELDPAGRVSNRLSKQVPCSQLLCPHTSVIQSSLRTCCWSIQLHVPLTVAYKHTNIAASNRGMPTPPSGVQKLSPHGEQDRGRRQHVMTK